MRWCYGWRTPINMGGMHGRRFPGMMGGHGFGGGFLMVLFWALVIAAVIYLIVRLTRSSSGSVYRNGSGEDEAIGILRQRFAKGEIDREEFEEKMKALE